MSYRDAYLERVEAQRRRLSAETALLRTRLGDADLAERDERLEELRDLRAREADLAERIERLRATRDEGWEAARDATDTAIEEMKRALGEAMARFPKG